MQKSPQRDSHHNRSQPTLLRKYQQLTSPLLDMEAQKVNESIKAQIRSNVPLRLDAIQRNHHKIIDHNSLSGFADVKAQALIYRIPEFSTPEINYEVCEKIKSKMSTIKNEIVEHLPEISKSSNYLPKKLEHQFNHRSQVKELEGWLREKLKSPPTSYDQSIEYKNMIMGIGMKELIRILNKRCHEEGKMAEEIWELTWSICREIIVYLGQRAKKCEDILQEEIEQSRRCFQQQITNLQEEKTRNTERIEFLLEENSSLTKELKKTQKRKDYLQSELRRISFTSFQLEEQFKNVLEENLALYLQVGDKNKKGWIKKMYKNIKSMKTEENEIGSSKFSLGEVRVMMQKRVEEVMQDRDQLENVTGEMETQKKMEQQLASKNTKPKKRKRKVKKNAKVQPNSPQKEGFQQNRCSIDEASEYEYQSQSEQELQSEQCDFINKLKQQFVTVDNEVQTQAIQTRQSSIGTVVAQILHEEIQVNPFDVLELIELGVNTEQPTKESKKKKTNTVSISKQNRGEASEMKPKKNTSFISSSSSKSKNSTDKSRKKLLESIKQESEKNRDANVEPESSSISQLPSSHRYSELPKVINQKGEIMNSRQNKSVILDPTSVQALTKTKSQKLKSIKEIQDAEHSESQKATHLPQRQSRVTSLDVKKENQNVLKVPPSNDLRNQTQRHLTKSVQNEHNFVCSNCYKILSNDESRNQKKQACEPKHRSDESPTHSSNSEDNQFDKYLQENQKIFKFREKKNQKKQRRSSGYAHDISYKKEEEQTKSIFYDKVNNEENEFDRQQLSFTLDSKNSSFKVLFFQLQDQNKDFIASLTNSSINLNTEHLEQYFELVREINCIQDGKLMMSEKSVCSVIEKNIIPIMNELLGQVKKSCKNNKIKETIKSFTSLPSIVFNRISRKYGMKILAMKNMKILLSSLKYSKKITDKYRMIELMMFTDCKSPFSEDLYIYLLVMGLLDPTFSSSRIVSYEEADTVKKLCLQHLTIEKQVYAQFDRMTKEEVDQVRTDKHFYGYNLQELIKAIITSYRFLKIAKIEELGFIYLMLKKNNFMQFKNFVYFIDSIHMDASTKVAICKKLLEFCDIKTKQKIGITENMFSKFLMNCPEITLELLESSISLQKKSLSKQQQNDQILNSITTKILKTTKQLVQTSEFKPTHTKKPSLDDLSLEGEDSESIRQTLPPRYSQTPKNRSQENIPLLQRQSSQEEEVKIPKKVKQYSSFTYQICSYLQNVQETKYLTQKQARFVSDYLTIYILQSELNSLLGVIDYLSTSMLDLMCLAEKEFRLQDSPNI